MAYGTQPPKPSEHNPNDFAYLCPDASKKPIVGEPCIWAARPWQGYMTPDSDEDDVAQLRVAITKLNELGESTHASWIASVLALNNVTLAKANKGPYTAENYLEKGILIRVDLGTLSYKVYYISWSHMIGNVSPFSIKINNNLL